MDSHASGPWPFQCCSRPANSCRARQRPIWSNGPDLPTELVRATGVYFPANGRFYAMGGRMSDAPGADMTTPYEYNPKTNTWAYKTAPFPDNQVSNMACGVLTVGRTPYIYCVGGTAAGGTTTATKRVFRYDPVTDTIQTAGIEPWNESAPDTLPGGFAVVQNKLYILGGFTVGNSVTNRIFEFTPGNSIGSQWTQKAATLPVALGFVPATAIGNLIFTAGGATFAPCALTETNDSYVYDPGERLHFPHREHPEGDERDASGHGRQRDVGLGRRETCAQSNCGGEHLQPCDRAMESGFTLEHGTAQFRGSQRRRPCLPGRWLQFLDRPAEDGANLSRHFEVQLLAHPCTGGGNG